MRFEISTSNFAPLCEEEFKRRKNQPGYLEAVQFEHYQIATQQQLGPFKHFLKKENKRKNRYRDILCWDETRVKITPQKDDTDYIHANYVDSFGIPKKYVATQGPLEKTIEQFWQMIWEQNSRIIVMLTELCIAGKEKCAPYWYTHESEQQTFKTGEFSIKTVNEERKSGYVETIFDVCHCTTGERKQIKHYLYSDWPDHGVPSKCHSFMKLILTVNKERQQLLTEMADGLAPGPIIVHCSAGVGRTGTFCAVDSCLHQLAKTRTISVPETLLKIRKQRYFSLMVPEQYIYVHTVIHEFIRLFEKCPDIRDLFCAY